MGRPRFYICVPRLSRPLDLPPITLLGLHLRALTVTPTSVERLTLVAARNVKGTGLVDTYNLTGPASSGPGIINVMTAGESATDIRPRSHSTSRPLPGLHEIVLDYMGSGGRSVWIVTEFRRQH